MSMTKERLAEIRANVAAGLMFGDDAPDLLVEVDRLREAIRKHRESYCGYQGVGEHERELWRTIEAGERSGE